MIPARALGRPFHVYHRAAFIRRLFPQKQDTPAGVWRNATLLRAPATDMGYVEYDIEKLALYLTTLNRMLANRNQPGLASVSELTVGPTQLKILVDLCHSYGIAVVFDIVYNHAGGFDGKRSSSRTLL